MLGVELRPSLTLNLHQSIAVIVCHSGVRVRYLWHWVTVNYQTDNISANSGVSVINHWLNSKIYMYLIEIYHGRV